ncbi:Diacylglycerol acyltransferase [Phytophthora palmivora]|uniref:Acyltransferase n=1 Tax=Phytophthora palmivora TaxID=4796 RepID=A0A2P4Y777_9STRA|nr:Diacylglycerol acyltransferase [Phytophthora palmivora]
MADSRLRHAAYGRTSAWPNNDAVPELQTVRGFVARRFLLWSLFGLWIVGLGAYIVLWMYSGLCVARWAWTAMQSGWMQATPPPIGVQGYLVFTVLYESYHYVTRDSPHLWPRMRRLARCVLLHYPYFRLNVTIFEERELAKQKLRLKEQHAKDRDDNKYDEEEKNEAEHLSPEAAVKAVEENDITPYVEAGTKNLFGFHPHGVLTCGFSFNGAYHMGFERSACRWLSAENLFWFPLIRDILNWMEYSSCAKTNMLKFMRRDQNVSIIPGGFEEATLFQRGKHRLYLKNRFGFIKIALQHGYNVHPVYTFGEEYTYHAFPYLQSLRLQLNRFRIPGTLFFGDATCFYLPRNDVDLITVVGKPLRFPRIEHPTKEDVQKFQAQYVSALKNLFDNYKGVYAVDPNATLEIF